MENKVSYTIVGIFVLSFFIGIILFVIWIARFDIDESKLKRYKIYVQNDSVSGLQKNSQVLYKGLDIGLVEEIVINPNNIERVEISIYITDYTMIRKNSYALIQSLGITGNKYLEIVGGTNEADILEVPLNGFAQIPLHKTFLSEISDNATDLFKKVDKIVGKVDTMMSEKSMNNISNSFDGIENIVQNIDTSTKHLITQQKEVDTLISSLNKLTSNENISNIKNTISNAKDSTANFSQLLKNDLKELLLEVKKSANIEVLKEKLDATLQKIDQALEKISDDKTNPIFTTREITYGPGEIKE